MNRRRSIQRIALTAAALSAFALRLRAEDNHSDESPDIKRIYHVCDCDPATRRIEATLDQPLKAPLKFVDAPLNQIASALSEDYGIPMMFDGAALDAVGASPESKVTINIANVSLRSAIDWTLRNAVEDLTYVIDDEVLLITIQDDCGDWPVVCVYRVDDLGMTPGPSPVESRSDYTPLADLICNSVERDSWRTNGTGEGEIAVYPPGILVISQTKSVHEKIAEFLQKLRRVRREILNDHAKRQETAGSELITRSIVIDDSFFGLDERTRILHDAILKSVDWETDAVPAEKTFLYVMPSRILVRHLPLVVAQVEDTAKELTHTPQVNARSVSSGTSAGGGKDSRDLADPASSGDDNGRLRTRGGEGFF